MTSKILRGDGVTELANIKSVIYTETVNAGEGLRPGCVASSSINVECFGSQTDAPAQDEALTYYQVVNGVETLVGIFYTEPSIPSKGTYKFVAYDAVAKLDVDFSARLNAIQDDFPMSIYDLVSEACSVAGVTLGSASWPLSTQTVQAFYADNLTCRNILQYAAEIACRFVRCDTSGEVVFDWYTTNSTSIYPGGNDNTKVAYKQNGLTYDNTNVYVVDSVAIKPSGVEGAAYIYPTSVGSLTATDPNGDGNIILTNVLVSDSGSGNILMNAEAEDENTDGNVDVIGSASQSVNPLILGDNLLLTNASDATYLAVAQNIYNVMSALPSYRHSTTQLFVDENPFHAGEFVSVTDAQGVSFTTPVFTMTVSASGANLVSSGKVKYQEQSSTNLAKSVANLASNIVQIDKLKVGWADIQEAIVQYLKLWGFMEVFEDDTLTTSGGKIGYVTGDNEFGSGIAMRKREYHDGQFSSGYWLGSAIVAGEEALFLGHGRVMHVDGGVEVNERDFPMYFKMKYLVEIIGGDQEGEGEQPIPEEVVTPVIDISAGGFGAGPTYISQPNISLSVGEDYPQDISRRWRPINTFNGFSDFEHITAPEIGDLSTLNTTNKSSLVGAINEHSGEISDIQNAIVKTLLWTNSDQSTFSATTLTSTDLADDLSNYNTFIITCHQRNNSYTSPYAYVTRVVNMKEAAVGDTVNCNMTDVSLGSSYEIIVRQRVFRINRLNNTVEVTTGYYGNNGTSGNNSDTTMVPISIYGMNI